MTNQIDGEKSYVDIKYEEIKKKIEEYYNSIGLVLSESSITDILHLDKDSLNKLPLEMCNEYGYKLARYGLFLQQTISKHTAIINWIESTIKKLISKDIDQYKAYSFEEKKIKAINGNSYTKALNDIKIQVQLKLDSISYLPSHIKNIQDAINRISYARTQKHD